MFRVFAMRWQNLLGAVVVILFVAAAVTAPKLAPPLDPAHPSSTRKVGVGRMMIPRPPSSGVWLGTLPGGLDVFYSLVWGTRSALRFGLTVTLIAAVFGVLAGAISGYAGGLPGGLILRVADAFLAFPVIAGVWLFQQVMRPASIWTGPTPLQSALAALGFEPVMVTLILFSWMPYTRLVHANVQRLKTTDFVAAARALGASPAWIILRHLIPNAISPAVVLAARDVGGMVILEAAFTFIGVGGSSVWGAMLVAGRDYVIGMGGNPLTYWWTFLPITLALIVFGIGWNLLGDGLNTALDPHTRRSG